MCFFSSKPAIHFWKDRFFLLLRFLSCLKSSFDSLSSKWVASQEQTNQHTTLSIWRYLRTLFRSPALIFKLSIEKKSKRSDYSALIINSFPTIVFSSLTRWPWSRVEEILVKSRRKITLYKITHCCFDDFCFHFITGDNMVRARCRRWRYTECVGWWFCRLTSKPWSRFS